MSRATLAASLAAGVSACLLAVFPACGKGSGTEHRVGSTSGEPPARPPAASPRAAAFGHDDPAGPLHEYRKLSNRLSMGASPESEEDFEFLAREGVKTILTVDGARPDVEAARRRGLRYVHIPIGYDGISAATQAWLARAFAELPAPFYVHCHHGKHRGPAACTIGRMSLDGITPEQAVAEMKAQGTDPKYRGLYAVPGEFAAITPEALAAAPSEFPETARIPGLTAVMVDVDHTFDRLKLVKAAGWAAPEDHPDVDPPHEATILEEHYRELGRSEDVANRDETFRRLLKAGEDASSELAAALRARPVEPAKAAVAYDAVSSSCSKCHTLYRDNK